MSKRNRGYYLNSLKNWRAGFLSEQRLGMARLVRMQAMNHQDAPDQALLLGMKADFIGTIDKALESADAELQRAGVIADVMGRNV